MTKTTALIVVIIAAVVIVLALTAGDIHKNKTVPDNTNTNNSANTKINSDTTITNDEYLNKLALCSSIPNGSIQDVVEHTKVFINLPRDIYKGTLQFHNLAGNASADHITSAGLPGEASQANSNCKSYYIEFDGKGSIEVFANSSVSGVPDYKTTFNVTDN